MALQESSATIPTLTVPSGGNLLFCQETGYGCLKATGEDALDLLNRLSTNKVDHLEPGHWAPTVLTSDRGRIVDLLSVINVGDFVYLLTSPGQQQQVIEWLDKYTIMEDLEVEDVSATTAVIAVADAGAEAVLGLQDGNPERLPGLQYPAPKVAIGGKEFIGISRPLGSTECCLLVVSYSDVPAVVAALGGFGSVRG